MSQGYSKSSYGNKQPQVGSRYTWRDDPMTERQFETIKRLAPARIPTRKEFDDASHEGYALIKPFNKGEASDYIGYLMAKQPHAEFKTAEEQVEEAATKPTNEPASEEKLSNVQPHRIEESFYVLLEFDPPQIIKIQRSQYGATDSVTGKGFLYGKKLVLKEDEKGEHWKGHWEKITGAVSMLFTEVRAGRAKRLTIDDAKTYGKLYGVCMICGRILTDEKSISEGVGPVCGGRI